MLEEVTFATSNASLTPDSYAMLERVAASLKEYPEVKLEVGGHTDSSGSAATNQRLSQARTEAVRDYLVSQGVDASRLTAKGYGPAKPIADNTSAEGRTRNRRVKLARI